MLAVLVLLAIGLALGWRRDAARARDLEAELARRTRAFETALAVSDTARSRSDAVAVRTRSSARRLDEAREDLKGRTDSGRAILADTAAGLRELRIRLAATIASAERLDAELLTYRANVDSLLTAHLAERQAWDAEREAARAVVEVQREALEEGRCAIFFAPCPTRRTSFTLGVVVAVVVVVLL